MAACRLSRPLVLVGSRLNGPSPPRPITAAHRPLACFQLTCPELDAYLSPSSGPLSPRSPSTLALFSNSDRLLAPCIHHTAPHRTAPSMAFLQHDNEDLGELTSARYGKDLVRVCRVVRHPATEDGKPGKQEGGCLCSRSCFSELSLLTCASAFLIGGPSQSSSTSSRPCLRATLESPSLPRITRESFLPTLVRGRLANRAPAPEPAAALWYRGLADGLICMLAVKNTVYIFAKTSPHVLTLVRRISSLSSELTRLTPSAGFATGPNCLRCTSAYTLRVVTTTSARPMSKSPR